MIAIILSALALVVAAVALFFALKPREVIKETKTIEKVGEPFFEVKYTPDGKYLLLSNKYKGLHVQGFISCNDK